MSCYPHGFLYYEHNYKSPGKLSRPVQYHLAHKICTIHTCTHTTRCRRGAKRSAMGQTETTCTHKQSTLLCTRTRHNCLKITCNARLTLAGQCTTKARAGDDQSGSWCTATDILQGMNMSVAGNLQACWNYRRIISSCHCAKLLCT